MDGEEKAWELLAACEPLDVCSRARATHSTDAGYTLLVLGSPVAVDPTTRTITGSSPEAELVLTKAAYFSRLSILRYLLDAQPIEPSGRLVGPAELRCGQFFLDGSHKLPLDRVAERFGEDPAGFAEVAGRFGGQPRPHGDVAAELLPLPRVPLTLILWLRDDEFPARSYLLFDDTCEWQLPPDILWSVAMICTIIMLRG